VTVAGASTLDTTAPLVLANNVNVNANLSVAGSNNLTLGGVIAGAGTDQERSGRPDADRQQHLQRHLRCAVRQPDHAGQLGTGQQRRVNLGAAATLNLGGSGSLASLTGSGTALIGGGNT
jgi:hypothetical protein